MNRPIDRPREGLADRAGRLPRLSGNPISREGSAARGRSGLTFDRANRFGFDRRPGRGGAIGGTRWDRSSDFRGSRSGLIHVRPRWSNLSNDRLASIGSRWHSALSRSGAWRDRPFIRDRWHRWGLGVRTNWWPRWRDEARGWFRPEWWRHHDHGFGGWHYWNRFNDFDYGYWWGAPAWPALTNWFAWPTPVVWNQPYYYDYGPGGNVVYENNYVYVNGERVASADEFAESAAALATVPPPPSEEVVAQAEWMPLGTFALSSGENDTEPRRVIQLAVDREGIISGTLYDVETDEAQAIQGQVDKETQRVAFRVGESEDIVFETGLYNLTQEEAPVLMHFGTEWTENYLLVRLDEPQEQGAGTAQE